MFLTMLILGKKRVHAVSALHSDVRRQTSHAFSLIGLGDLLSARDTAKMHRGL